MKFIRLTKRTKVVWVNMSLVTHVSESEAGGAILHFQVPEQSAGENQSMSAKMLVVDEAPHDVIAHIPA
jgi:hypothetical protein